MRGFSSVEGIFHADARSTSVQKRVLRAPQSFSCFKFEHQQAARETDIGEGKMDLRTTERAAILRGARGKHPKARDAAAQTRAIVERANGYLFMALVLIDEARRIARRTGRRR